jgi:hypothetical protein
MIDRRERSRSQIHNGIPLFRVSAMQFNPWMPELPLPTGSRPSALFLKRAAASANARTEK